MSSEESPEVSLITVNWNTRDLLLKSLEALLATAEGLNVEIVVVDNGSRDGSAEAVKEAFPQVTVIANKKNLGFARAVNQALARAHAPYIVIFNTDIIFTAGALANMLAYVKENADVGLVGANLLNEDGTPQNSFAPFPGLCTELLNKGMLRLLFPEKYATKASEDEARDVDSLVGACMLVERGALEKVGGLDERYFFYLEETDWAKRMKESGYRVVHLGRAKVYHLQGKSAKSFPARSRIEYYRSRYLYFQKWHGRPVNMVLEAGLILRLLLEIVFSFLGNFFTLFCLKKERQRLAVRLRIFLWHLVGKPKDWGLEGA
jgi:hypothetical protein